MNDKKDYGKLLFSIGLTRRAGKLFSGTEMVIDGIRSGKVCRVIACSDVSENTMKKISNSCAYYNVVFTVIDISQETLGKAIGKMFAACVGITDPNLSELINRNL